MRILSPDETRAHSIFTMVGQEGAGLWRWLMVIVLAVIAWLGGVALLGPFRPTQVSRLVASFAPLEQIYWAALAAAGLITVIAVLMRRWPLGYAAATVAAYLAAFYLGGLLFALLPPGVEIPLGGTDDAVSFAVSRLWFAGPIVIALAVVWFVFRARIGGEDLALGVGNWFVASRDVSVKETPSSWLVKLFTGYLLFVVAFAALTQFGVGFAPITSGAVFALLPAIATAAATNAIAEEFVYRGFIQPAFVRYAGVGAGLWLQGLFFGIIHWGLSVGILAALPTSLLIGVGSVIWGKAAYETRGMSWTIAAHFMIDVVIMAAYFVPR